MNASIAIVILIAGLALEGSILSRARKRAKREDSMRARLACYGGRRIR
jgi:hypothetical protein